MRHSILAVSLLAAALSLAGCQSMPPQASQAGAPTAPVEAEAGASGSVADDNLNAVLWVQTSAEYRAAAETVYRAATDQLDAALAQAHWDALLPSDRDNAGDTARSEEHTSELQSLMRISYAVFCLKKKKKPT